MTEEEYLKNLSYDIKTGYIKFYDDIKEIGFISINNLEKDIFFRKKDVFNNNYISANYNVEFILNESNPDKIRAEKIIIKEKRDEKIIYGIVIDDRDNKNKTWEVSDNNGNKYLINKKAIENQDNYDENAYIKLTLVNDKVSDGLIVHKGYVGSYLDQKQEKRVQKIYLENDREKKFSFQKFNLINSNNIEDGEIVYFKQNHKHGKDGNYLYFASDIYITKEKMK